MPRVILLVIDQLPGHWVEGMEVADGMPPVNVWGYHRKGLVPNFSHIIEDGIFAFAWNRGECNTPYGMKYLATGRYDVGPVWKSEAGQMYYSGNEVMGLFEFAKHHDPARIKAATFTTDYWAAPGYFYTAADTYALPASFPDERMWREYAMPYLRRWRDRNLVYIYFPVMDTVSYCPSFLERWPYSKFSKHRYMLFLDSLLGEVVEFLQAEGFWDETYLIVASDHGYHAGCSTARKEGATGPNWCCDHPGPHDCEVWDFENDRSTGEYSGCTRRVLFLVSGGALEPSLRGRVVEEAEIIDVAPTIADLMDLPYECEGKSIFRRLKEV